MHKHVTVTIIDLQHFVILYEELQRIIAKRALGHNKGKTVGRQVVRYGFFLG